MLADLELSEKFNLERQLEVDTRDPSQLPSTIEDFLSNSPFKVLLPIWLQLTAQAYRV